MLAWGELFFRIETDLNAYFDCFITGLILLLFDGTVKGLSYV